MPFVTKSLCEEDKRNRDVTINDGSRQMFVKNGDRSDSLFFHVNKAREKQSVANFIYHRTDDFTYERIARA